ncbi:DUF6262 family protein [Streptomyces sp. ITFR-16]|uniref:DUF6262 family protein n=1 Tax=Streptomyces sp. ITFR-16 TaxID=3075198 RepID=UPI002888FDC3|nr:DUF6262 family protein [Streptomyces sp. ITFR-16]WNI22178.1 DUF6262 family protein [Streptomyces sp. ITFR-16]
MAVDAHQQTAAANETRRRSSEAAVRRVQDALKRLRREKTPITFAAVARRASVSRTFLYSNQQARSLVTAAAEIAVDQRVTAGNAEATAQEASWRERALNAEDALKSAFDEIRLQRGRIGELMGQVRDLEAEWTEEAIQRITSENTNLKQRVRRLSEENRALDERLKAARSTLRFQDKRLSDLEVQLLDRTSND